MTTPSLPTSGSSYDTWGNQLNTWLLAGHNADGTLATNEQQFDFSQAEELIIPAPILSADSLQTLTAGSTIYTATDGSYAAIPVVASSAVTGLIIEQPVNGWSQIVIINTSAYTMTFDISGISNVADGTSDVINALAAKSFIYNATTSLWYKL